MISRFNVGGTSQWLFELSCGLSKNGIENILLLGDCPTNEVEDSRIHLLPKVRIPGLGPNAGIRNSLLAFLHLRAFIKEYEPDIVNTHTSKAGFLGRIASKTIRKKVKTVHTFHGHVLKGYFGIFTTKVVWFVELILSIITDYFFIVSESVLRELQQSRIIRGSNAIPVFSAVPDYTLGNREILRKKFGISESAIVVGWLGRKVHIKRLDRILSTAASFPQVTFLVAGIGESIRSTFSLSFERLQLSNVIELNESIPSDIWSISDIAILTSDNEGLPTSLIEAALASVPALAIDAGGTREVVIDGVTGILCSTSPQHLIKSLEKLVNDSDLRRQMGSNARRFALEKFSPSKNISFQIQGYRNALNL